MFATRRHSHNPDIWPGFVDALAAVLMVIIFVLMTFVIAHLYLTNTLNDRDLALGKMNEQLATINLDLRKERSSRESIQNAYTVLETRLNNLADQLTVKTRQLDAEKISRTQETDKAVTLSRQIAELLAIVNRLNTALQLEQSNSDNIHEKQFISLGQRLEESITQKLAELEALRQELAATQTDNSDLKEQVTTLTRQTLEARNKGRFGQFRSDFLTKLSKVIGDRQDIRVVGDRFIFQSEVLFDQGSAELGKEGHEQLNKLGKALKDISLKIPESVAWVLRVDGHTDTLPINRPQFPSNWELSSARSIAVVRYLISQGIDPKNLVAAGFGEFQPLNGADIGENSKLLSVDTQKAMARNRRIEFRLDQR
jgi:chemotaxis protein MotB